MSRRPLSLIGVKEVARLAGVSPTRAHTLVNRPDFPEVYATSPYGRLWLPEEVEEWARRRREEKEARRRRLRS